MKIRSGFVSNSSSSSYICDVCGEEAIGYDIDLAEYEMYQCENGHTFCESHIKNEPTYKQLIFSLLNSKKEYYIKYKYEDELKDIEKILGSNDELSDQDIEDIEQEYDLDYYIRYEHPSEYCPICTFDILSKDDLYKYVDKKYTLDKIRNEIKDEFENYDDFKKNINEPKIKKI